MNAERYILLVEDDKAIQDSLIWILESEGYHLKVVNNGLEGMEALQANQLHFPSLIILDMMMPVMDGFEFHRLKQANPTFKQIPTIFMSADHQLENKISKSQNEEILNKPVDLDVLLNTIETYIAM